MPSLSVSELVMQYAKPESPILTLPNLMLAAGEHVAIMGVSGSGKTTLVNLLAGLDVPSQGEIYWDSCDITKLSAKQRDSWRFEHVGIIMQNFCLYQGLSALQNVLLPLSFRHFRLPVELTSQAQGLLEWLAIKDSQIRVEHLSRGEMQRVAIARALLMRPPIIIADEPTASLDKPNGEQIMQLLIELATAYQSTLLVVTHDPHFAAYLPRQITLTNGQIRSDVVQQRGGQ